MSKRLVEAAGNGNLSLVKQYLDEGDDIHYEQDAALHLASGNDHVEVIKLLLNRGANIHALDDVAFRWASYNGHVEVVKILLDRGADRSARNYEALRWARKNNYKKIVNLLENYFPLIPSSEKQNDQEVGLKFYNTDGRMTCYKCGGKLKQVVGFTGSNLNYCPNCEE